MNSNDVNNLINNLKNDCMEHQTFTVISVNNKTKQAVIRNDKTNKEYVIGIK